MACSSRRFFVHNLIHLLPWNGLFGVQVCICVSVCICVHARKCLLACVCVVCSIRHPVTSLSCQFSSVRIWGILCLRISVCVWLCVCVCVTECMCVCVKSCVCVCQVWFLLHDLIRDSFISQFPVFRDLCFIDAFRNHLNWISMQFGKHFKLYKTFMSPKKEKPMVWRLATLYIFMWRLPKLPKSATMKRGAVSR